MTIINTNLKQQLKNRLFECISAHVDMIGYVPDDIGKLIGDSKVDTLFNDLTGSEYHQVEHDARGAVNEPGSDCLSESINDHYDSLFYDIDGMMGVLHRDTEYRNIGYWDETTLSQNQASENLQDTLLDFIPEKTGRILDVACGLGASTARLLNHYQAEDVWAINISEKQVETARQKAPGSNVHVMNAVDLKFDDDFFDNILCIEAVMHFETREKFLEESLRVLKRNGYLVLSDILLGSKDRLEQIPIYPGSENHIESIEDYRALLLNVGFRNIIIEDVTPKVWGAHFKHAVNRIHQKFYSGEIDIIELTDNLWNYYSANAVLGSSLLISVQK